MIFKKKLLFSAITAAILTVSASAGGTVVIQAKDNVSVIGENEVEAGDKFNIRIEANIGYYIEKVTLNGTAVDMSTWVKDDGYIVAEYPKEDVVNKNYENFRVRLCRRYSSSEVLILERE